MQSYKFRIERYLEQLVNEYQRFEPFLRRAATHFMSEMGFTELKGRFITVGFYNMPQINKIRELRCLSLGQLMSIHGTVTRTTEVKPELLTGSFRCLECDSLV